MGRSDILTTNESSVRAHAREPWQEAMRSAIRTVDELRDVVGLEQPIDAGAADAFPVFVPRGFAAKMRRGDSADPLLRQVLPVAYERQSVEGFVVDPLHESHDAGPSGLLRKYDGRALLVVNGTCAVHCRYCFRRHFPYSEQGAAGD